MLTQGIDKLVKKLAPLLPLLIGITGGLVPFVGVAILDRAVSHPPVPDPATVRLLSAVLFFTGVTVSTLYTTVGQIGGLTKQIQTALGTPDIEAIGTATRCFGKVLTSFLEGASEVKNTLCVFRVSDNLLRDSGYCEHDVSEIKTAIEQFLSKKMTDTKRKTWYDILSQEVLSSQLWNWLPFVSVAQGHSPNRYVLKCLRESYPVVNFTVIYYEDEDTPPRVCFGWGHHRHDVDGDVFSSTNKTIVGYFEKLWKTLEEDAWEIAPNELPPIMPQRIVGHWLTAAYEDKSNALKDFAYVQISENEKLPREIVAEGQLMDEKGVHPKPGLFRFTVAHLQDRRLWFVSSLGDHEGIGWYDFDKAAGQVGTLFGHLDPGHEKKRAWVFGVRLDGQAIDKMKTGHPGDKKEVINEYRVAIEKAHTEWLNKNGGTTLGPAA